MEKITSEDGVSIAYHRTGSGKPLILVHGTNGDSSRWAYVQPRLAQHFTVYAIDRRGRGQSGDGESYSIQQEYQDIAALANSMAGPVDVFGHSFGAACVLGATPYIANLRRLILYEPPMLKTQRTPEHMITLEKMDAALQQGSLEEVVVLMLRDMLQIPTAMIERMHTNPAWAAQLPGAHTIPRELRQSDAYGADLGVIQAITAPTLFLLGSESPDFFRVTTDALSKLIPNSRVTLLPGQQHSAMLTAPDLLAQEIIQFLIPDDQV